MARIPDDRLRFGGWGKEGQGAFVVAQLFDKSFCRDYTDKGRKPPFFTMGREDKDGMISFPKVFIPETADDPTEYTFAMEWFGDWDHWEKICNHTVLKPWIDKYRRERDMLIKSKAVKKIFDEANSGEGRNQFAAAKYLAEKGYIKETVKRPATAPTKKDRTDDEILEDYERLGLNAQD